MFKRRDIGWWYWLATVPLVAGAVMGCAWSLGAAMILAGVQTIHFAVRGGGMTGFAVQVRTAYLGLLAVGSLPGMGWIHWIQLGGTSAMVLLGYCPLARVLSLLPWNRQEPLTASLVARTFFTLRRGIVATADCSGRQVGVTA